MSTFQTRDGATLHYHDVGQGPTVVMLHAFGMRGSMWLPFVLPMADKRRFILLDFRGFGRSHRTPLSTGDVLGQNADDVFDLIAHLGLSRPKLVGFSLGAGTALAYGHRYGLDAFEAYLHLDFAPRIRNTSDFPWGLMGAENVTALEVARELLEAFEGVDRARPFSSLPPELQREYLRWFGRFFLECFHQPWWRAVAWAGGRVRPSLQLLLGEEAWPVHLACVRSLVERDYDFRESLRSTQIPIWVGVGQHSKIFPPEGGRAMASYAPNARVVEFGGAGHVLLAEAPMRFRRTLRRFLSRKAHRGNRYVHVAPRGSASRGEYLSS